MFKSIINRGKNHFSICFPDARTLQCALLIRRVLSSLVQTSSRNRQDFQQTGCFALLITLANIINIETTFYLPLPPRLTGGICGSWEKTWVANNVTSIGDANAGQKVKILSSDRWGGGRAEHKVCTGFAFPMFPD